MYELLQDFFWTNLGKSCYFLIKRDGNHLKFAILWDQSWKKLLFSY